MNWNDIPPLVEKIIAARTVTVEFEATSGSGTVTKSTVTRPMRFREFSAEIKVDNARAYRYIRGGIIPLEKTQKIIIAWCEKHRAKLNKK